MDNMEAKLNHEWSQYQIDHLCPKSFLNFKPKIHPLGSNHIKYQG